MKRDVIILLWGGGGGALFLGLAISDKKIIPRKTEYTKQKVIADGIPAVPRNRKLSGFILSYPAEEKNARNPILLNRNRSKLSRKKKLTKFC